MFDVFITLDWCCFVVVGRFIRGYKRTYVGLRPVWQKFCERFGWHHRSGTHSELWLLRFGAATMRRLLCEALGFRLKMAHVRRISYISRHLMTFVAQSVRYVA